MFNLILFFNYVFKYKNYMRNLLFEKGNKKEFD